MREIALHIMDIAENSIGSGARNILIKVLTGGSPAVLRIIVKDDGTGIEKKMLKHIEDPFFTSRSTRGVGLGIPLLKQQAEMAGGRLEISSQPGMGTEVDASFMLGHPDRQPLGDLEGSWMLLAASNQNIDWELNLESESGHFSLSTRDIKSVLEVNSISGNELIRQMKTMIRNNMEELGLTRL